MISVHLLALVVIKSNAILNRHYSSALIYCALEYKIGKMPKRVLDGNCGGGASSAWKEVGESLLRFINTENFMMCVDLDHTLWPISCFECTEPPYVAVKDGSAGGKAVTYVSRRERTVQTLALHSEVYDILEWCHIHGIALSICSKSQIDDAAKGKLKCFEMC